MNAKKFKPIDCHVHIVGDGSSGSGCRVALRSPYHKALARGMCYSMGLSQDALKDNLDNLYLEKLLSYIRESSLSAVVGLAYDHPYDRSGKIIDGFASFYVPNDYVLQLSKKHQEILPGVSIHPARPDALDELEKCISEGAVLMKCLPNSQNIDCGDKKYARFWERMAKAGLPLLAHTGGELSLPVYDKKLSGPELLREPLEAGVTVIACHCATNSLFVDKNYLDDFQGMLQKYPNLYGDNSGLLTPIRARHFSRLKDSAFMGRLIHGSDLPIPVSARWARLWGLISRQDYDRIKKIGNPLEREYQTKRALGFGDDVFNRLWDLMP